MRRFCFSSEDRSGDKAVLTGGEAHHFARVLRGRAGQRVILFNEKGEEFIATVVGIAPRVVELRIDEKMEIMSSPAEAVHLALALIKGDRLDRSISGATELGAGKIILVRCDRSVPRIRRPDVGKKLARWKRIALSAAKQSGRPGKPAIEYFSTWDELLRGMEHYDRVFIALGKGKAGPASIGRREKVLVIVGPEGGFTDAEKSAALAAGAVPLKLGPFTLRSDTAAVTALSLVVNAFSIQNLSATKDK